MGETNYREGGYVTIIIIVLALVGIFGVLAFGEDNYCSGNEIGLYDCMFIHGKFMVIQENLDRNEADTIFNIYKSKANGTYIQPTIDDSWKLDKTVHTDSVLCHVEHYNKALKDQYGC